MRINGSFLFCCVRDVLPGKAWDAYGKNKQGKALKESETRGSTAMEQWKTNLKVKRPQKSKAFTGYGIAVAGDKVVALTSDTRSTHAVELYRKEDGSFLQSVELPAQPVNCGIAIAGNSIFVTLLDGRVISVK